MDTFFLNLIVHKQNRYQFMSLCISGISVRDGSRFNESGILKLENYSDQFSPVHEQFVQTGTVNMNRFNRLIKKRSESKARFIYEQKQIARHNVRFSSEYWLCKFINVSFATSDVSSLKSCKILEVWPYLTSPKFAFVL